MHNQPTHNEPNKFDPIEWRPVNDNDMPSDFNDDWKYQRALLIALGMLMGAVMLAGAVIYIILQP